MEGNSKFLNINGQTLANYNICYRLKENVQISDASLLQLKSDLSVQTFCSLDLQRNLIFVDMIFPNILADIALEAFFNNINSLSDYLKLDKSFTIVDKFNDALFYNLKIREFIKLLLFSDIQEEKLSSGTIYIKRKFIYNDINGVERKFNWDDNSRFIEFILPKIQVVADKKNACLSDKELFINLKIKVL